MLDSQVATLENAIARFEATGEVPGPLGSRHPSIAPFQALATRDGFIVVAAGNDDLFARLCVALGQPRLSQDPRFASNDLRTRNVDALAAELAAALAARSSEEWLAVLTDAGIPSGPINDVAAVLADPQVRARNMIISAGGLALAGNPIKLSGVRDPDTRPPAPALGQHGSDLDLL